MTTIAKLKELPLFVRWILGILSPIIVAWVIWQSGDAFASGQDRVRADEDRRRIKNIEEIVKRIDRDMIRHTAREDHR